jgi:hypothetical protein
MLKLGYILTEQGLLTDDQLKTALELQKMTGMKLGDLLIEKGMLSDVQIMKALELQCKMPYVDLSDIHADPKALSLIGEEYARKFCAIPIGFDDDKLIVAINDPLDYILVDEIGYLTSKKILPKLSTRKQIMAAIEINYSLAAGQLVSHKSEHELEKKTRKAKAVVEPKPETIIIEDLKVPEPVPTEAVSIAKPTLADTVSVPEPAPAEAVSIAKPTLADTVSVPEPAPAEIVSVPEPAPAEAVSFPEPASVEAVSILEPAPAEIIAVPEPAPAGIIMPLTPVPVEAAQVSDQAVAELPIETITKDRSSDQGGFMLDFTKSVKQHFLVNMIDNQMIRVRMPTKRAFTALIELQDKLANLITLNTNMAAQLEEIYDLCAKVLSNNLDQKEIGSEYLADLLDLEDLRIFSKTYSDFVNSVLNGTQS